MNIKSLFKGMIQFYKEGKKEMKKYENSHQDDWALEEIEKRKKDELHTKTEIETKKR